MVDCHGYSGSAAVHGSSPPRLSVPRIMNLLSGRRVVVTWDGGNGPHLYEIVEESMDVDTMNLLHNKTHICRVKVSELLDSHCNYVSLPTVAAHPTNSK